MAAAGHCQVTSQHFDTNRTYRRLKCILRRIHIIQMALRLRVIRDHLCTASTRVSCQKLDGHVALVTLTQPDKLNALSKQLIIDLSAVLRGLDEDPEVHVIVITGQGRAFCAGANLKDFQGVTLSGALIKTLGDFFSEYIPKVKKPMIAAVNGVALGGGLEIALHCDIVYAHESARFGAPEVKVGLIPGFGGTDLLTRCVGKYKAMSMVLSGEFISAQEAKEAGLVTKLVGGPKEAVVAEAIKDARVIAAKSLPVLLLAKAAVKGAMDTTMSAGLQYELMLFTAGFGLRDKEESVAAFLEKRQPKLTNT